MRDSTGKVLGSFADVLVYLVPLGLLAWASVAQAQWTANGRQVCSVASNKRLPTVVSDGAGGVIIGWRDDRGGNTDIYARALNSTGNPQWSTSGVAICSATDDQSSPMATTDAAGGAIIAWQDFRSGAQYDIYAQRISSAGVDRWAPNGVAVCIQGADQFNPVIAPDGAGGAFIAWLDFRAPISPQIFAQRVNASGVRQWTSSGIALCSASGSRGSPVITSDGKGGAIVAWEDGRTVGNYDIYAQRINAAGTVQWATDGVLVSTLGTDDKSPSIIGDGVGGAIVSWLGDHVFAQRLDSLGVRKWAGAGIPLSIAPGTQGAPRIISDGASGALVAWEDDRGAASSTDIYVQRVDANGSILWAQNGVAACAADSNQSTPVLAPDGLNGAIVAWQDFRGGSAADIYAQRIDALGSPRWTANGVVVCGAADVQQNPAILSDGTGGAIVVWEDLRSGTHQLYGALIGGDGTVPTLLSLVDATADQGHVALRWSSPANGGMIATVERREPSSEWSPLAELTADAGGMFRYDDYAIRPGGRYGYRLSYSGGSGRELSTEVWIDVPSASAFRLEGVRPNPSGHDMAVYFSLRDANPALLELIDMAGRRLMTLGVGSLGAGNHVVNLRKEIAGLPEGMYVLRLSQGHQALTTKAMIVR